MRCCNSPCSSLPHFSISIPLLTLLCCRATWLLNMKVNYAHFLPPLCLDQLISVTKTLLHINIALSCTYERHYSFLTTWALWGSVIESNKCVLRHGSLISYWACDRRKTGGGCGGIIISLSAQVHLPLTHRFPLRPQPTKKGSTAAFLLWYQRSPGYS